MTADEFINAHHPSKMWQFAANPDRCHIGKGMTIAQACDAYGAHVIYKVLCNLISDFVNYNQARSNLTTAQYNDLAAVIVTEFRGLKVAELVLFFAKAKAGRFGKFFSTIYPMDLTTQLCEWEKECNQQRNELLYKASERAKEQQRDEMYTARSVAAAEWITNNGKDYGTS